MSIATHELPNDWLTHDESMKPYRRRHLGWRVVGLTLKILLLFILLFRGHAKALETWAFSLAGAGFGGWAVYFGVLALISTVVGLPSGIGHQAVERRFQLSRQTWASWFIDAIKGLLVGAVLGGIVLWAIWSLVRTLGPHWWIGTWAFLIFFSVLLAQLAPVLFLRIFYELKPMDPSPLKDRLIKLSEKYGLSISEVYSWGLGAKTEKGNAAFTGLGRTKRIIIGDTLYQKFSPEEVEAVFAHELGHQVHNDLWKGIIASSAASLVVFWLAQLLDPHLARFFDAAPGTPFWLFVFFVGFSLIQMPAGVLLASFSRWREHQADRFAAADPRLRKELANALERLTYQNRGRFRPSRVMEFLTHSHPAPWRRILYLRGNSEPVF